MTIQMPERRWLVTLVFSIGAATMASLLTWHFAHRETVECVVYDTLRPVSALLADDRKIIDALRADGYAESESAILESYVARIRRDGVAKNGLMKQRIDMLVNNNTMVLAYVSKHATHARTAAFKTAADKFRDYAISFRDRWQSVFEIFMVGGNLPAAGPSFPAEFSDAVSAELHSAT